MIAEWNETAPPGWEWWPGCMCPLLYDRETDSFSMVGGDSGQESRLGAVVSPRGHYVIWGSGNDYVISELASGELVREVEADVAWDVYWSPNEQYVLVFDSDGRAFRVNITNGARRLVAGWKCYTSALTKGGRYALADCPSGADGNLVYLLGPLG